jgi:hypothetical protein
MTKRSVLLIALVLTAIVRVTADQPPAASTAPPTPRTATPGPTPAAAPAAERQPPRPRREGQPVNVKIEVTITDQRGSESAGPKKTVGVVTADGMSGYIRTQAAYSGAGDVWLNIDAEPEILTDGKIRLRINLQYDLPEKAQPTEPAGYGRLVKTQIRENLALILENGKPIIAAQSADPAVDRQVTIEVKAAVLR